MHVSMKAVTIKMYKQRKKKILKKLCSSKKQIQVKTVSTLFFTYHQGTLGERAGDLCMF